jgi:hypothetical protein
VGMVSVTLAAASMAKIGVDMSIGGCATQGCVGL